MKNKKYISKILSNCSKTVKGARIEIQDLRTSAAQPPTTTIQKKSANLKKPLIKKKTSDLGKNPIFFAPAARIFLAAFGGQNH